MTTLVIGAHPDDEVLGSGGTIAKLSAAGEEVNVLIVTDGSSTQYPNDEIKREEKNGGLEACCDALGVSKVFHGDLPDMQLDKVPHAKLNNFIGDYVATLRPSTIYTHYPDINRDHVRIFESTLVVARPKPGCFIKRLLAYPTPSATEWDAPIRKHAFSPNTYVDIEAFIEAKVRAFACYGTEIRPYPHPRSAEAIRVIAAGVGIKAGIKLAEEFVLLRHIG